MAKAELSNFGLFEKTNKLALRVEKRSSFKTKREIKTRRKSYVEKLSGNNLAKFQPNWSSGCRLGVQNVRTTRQNLLPRKKGNIFSAASCQ